MKIQQLLPDICSSFRPDSPAASAQIFSSFRRRISLLSAIFIQASYQNKYQNHHPSVIMLSSIHQ